MDQEIKPLEGFGRLRLGMSRTDVDALFEEKPRTFHRGHDPNETDHFVNAGIFVCYDQAGVVEAVELAEPARTVLNGRDLLSMTFTEARAFLANLDAGLVVDVDGLTSYALGVGAWSPFAKDDPQAPIESVIVFRKGYYD